jgi:hypothetical protein
MGFAVSMRAPSKTGIDSSPSAVLNELSADVGAVVPAIDVQTLACRRNDCGRCRSAARLPKFTEQVSG